MNTDWNWFFSSFSQSAAALLGIIGAFIISRLIGIDEKSNILNSDFEDLKIRYNKIKDTFSIRKYSWINQTYLKYNESLIEKIQEKQFENLSETEILDMLYSLDNRLYRDDASIMEQFNLLYNRFKPRPKPHLPVGMIYHTTPPPLFIAPDGLWDNVVKERDLINNYIIDARELIRKFYKHLESLQNFTSSLNTIKVIVWILIISFPLTVIYPLHFLPIQVGKEPLLTYNIFEIIENIFTMKNFLLSIFLISVEGIFIYFLFLINKIKKILSKLEKEHLEEYKDISSYCSYYRE